MLPVSSSQFFRQIMECYKTLLSLWVGLIVTPLSITLLFYLISLSSLCCSTFLAIHVLSHVYRMHWGLVLFYFYFFRSFTQVQMFFHISYTHCFYLSSCKGGGEHMWGRLPIWAFKSCAGCAWVKVELQALWMVKHPSSRGNWRIKSFRSGRTFLDTITNQFQAYVCSARYNSVWIGG